MIKKTQSEELLKGLHGGCKTTHIKRLLTKKDAIQGLDMFATVTIPVNGSIGYHLHEMDAEVYYILEGQGVFLDNGKIEKPVSSGNLCIIKQKQGHGLINTGNKPLKLIAVVWS